jgi:hypothetical protein
MADFQLLTELPQDLLEQMLLSFDGKSLSTLLLAACGCSNHYSILANAFYHVVRLRADLIITKTSHLPCAQEVKEFLASAVSEGSTQTQRSMGFMSSRLALLSYFESYAVQHTKTLIELPVYAGTLTIGRTWSSPPVTWIQVSTPFWNRHLVGAFAASFQRPYPGDISPRGIHVRPMIRNFATVPPIARVCGVRDMDKVKITEMVRERNVHLYILSDALEESYNSSRQISLFLVTEDQAKCHYPRFLTLPHDPYHFQQKESSSSHLWEGEPSLFCLWSPLENDDSAQIEDVIRQIIDLMQSIDDINDSAKAEGHVGEDEFDG